MPRSEEAASNDVFLNPTVFVAMLQQNWENVRHIKGERISFLNTFALIGAGTQSLLLSIRGKPPFEFILNLSMCALAVMGMLISLRLKAELEECLEKIEAIVTQARVERYMALERSEGALSHYPKFRWMFPVFYALAIVLFTGLSVQTWWQR